MSKNLSELPFRKGVEDTLFDKLGRLAQPAGAPSAEEMERLAEEFLVGKANVYGAASFYDFLKEENRGKEVYVCNGTACVCAGTQGKVHETLESHFEADQIGHMTCLGRCHENAAFHYKGQNYSGEDIAYASEIFSGGVIAPDTYSVGHHGPELLTAPDNDLQQFSELLRRALEMGQEPLLDEITRSGLRGRGGAGFPIGLKLDACRQADSDTKFIICNADEGDPGAYSDRYLLEERPLSVLFGMMVAGFVTGAEWGVLYIRAEYPDSVAVIERAIADLHDHGLLGTKILGFPFTYNFKVIKAQGAYICGEETALINSIEGQRPEVRTRPPYPTQAGLFNKPTVVNNVETLAALRSIVDQGGRHYAKIGTARSKGTKLVSLDSFFMRPGIYEVEMGTPLSVIIDELGGGFKAPVKAMQIGGPLGGIVPAEKFGELTLDYEAFQQQGFLLGHASMVCIPETFPMIDYLEHLMDFAQYESCGKCFPCRLGTKRGHELLKRAREGRGAIDRTLFADLLDTLQNGSLCAHGGGIPLPVRNALQYFSKELQPYFN